jgi:hypothetical protein
MAELRLRLWAGEADIGTPTPHAPPRRDGVLLQAGEVVMVALIVSVGGNARVSLADQLSVHKQAIHVHVCQEATILVPSQLVEFEPDSLPSHQPTIGLKSFLTAILGQFLRVVGLWSVAYHQLQTQTPLCSVKPSS